MSTSPLEYFNCNGFGLLFPLKLTFIVCITSLGDVLFSGEEKRWKKKAPAKKKEVLAPGDSFMKEFWYIIKTEKVRENGKKILVIK